MLAKITEFLNTIAAAVLQFLPDSPFAGYIDELTNVEWLPYINWFVPVGTMLGIATAWGVAIGVFYVYQMILRWAKVVGD